MAKKVLKNAKVVIDSFDFGNAVTDVEIDAQTREYDVTGMGDDFDVILLGAKSWSMTINGNDDFADNNVNEKIFAWWDAGVAVTIEVTAEDTTVSATNPKYSGSIYILNPRLLQASVQGPAKFSLQCRGSGALTRATS